MLVLSRRVLYIHRRRNGCATPKNSAPDAQRFYRALQRRLEKFGLQLAVGKTRVIPFSQSNEPGTSRFDFLGFEFFWDKDRAGKPHVKRRISRKKLRNSIANFTQWCKQNRHVPVREFFWRLNLKLRGYYNYYGVIGNADGLREFFNKAMTILLKWLNRRSQRRILSWLGFGDLLAHLEVPRPRIPVRPRIRIRTATCMA